MIVYLLIRHDCDDWSDVVGVYSTRENAEQALREAGDPDRVGDPADPKDLDISEWRVDAGPWEG